MLELLDSKLVCPFCYFVAAVYDGKLSLTAYIILAFALVAIIGGLSWCFNRAIKADRNPDHPHLSTDSDKAKYPPSEQTEKDRPSSI